MEDDLEQLLNNLTDAGTLQEEAPAAPPPEHPEPIAPVRPLAVPLEDRQDHAVSVADEHQYRKLVESTLENFDKAGTEVTDNYRKDREQLQEVIDYLQKTVIDESITNQHGAVPPAYIENLVKAHEIKGNLSLTLVKLLDSKTRLMAALKGQSIFQNNVINAPSAELEQILSGPVENDLGDT